VSPPVPKVIFDPQLLGTGWEAASFDAHRAMVRGIFGGALSIREREMYAEMTGGLAPRSRPPRTLVIVKSRRVAGTRIAVAIGQALALSDWPRAPGERPVVKFFAADRAQAGVAFGYAKGSLAVSPLLANEVVSVTQQRIELRNGNALEVSTSDDATLRGFTPVAYIVDEAAYVANLDALLAAMRPGLVTLPGSMLIIITTPAGADGPVYELDKQHYGAHHDDILVIHAHVSLFNPTIPQSFIDRELALDPYRAPAEWLCQFITGLASFVDAPLVDSLTRPEPRELPRQLATATGTPIRYVAAVDASGGRSDATGAAVSHVDGDRVIVDAVRRWPSPHDPAVVAAQVGEFLSGYGLDTASGDQYGAELARAVYRAAGVTLTAAPDSRSDTYLKLLPLMTTGRLELPPDPHLRRELLGLERRTGRGKEYVDHAPRGTDDLINAAALAAVAASTDATFVPQDPVIVRTTTFDDYADRDALAKHYAGTSPFADYFDP
jgi:hypothetical protein